jgi:F0F1-type ATP synthase delta subunit
MDNNQIDTINEPVKEIEDEPNNEKEMDEMLENCTKILNVNFTFRNKMDKFVFDRLPITPEDKIRILNEILQENADNLKNKSI